MPFTLSHPAAVWPLARRPLVPAALIAGSVAPDVPFYLFPGALPRGLSHTPIGVCSVDVALAAALVVAVHLLRRPVVALLPDAVRARLAGPAARGLLRLPQRGAPGTDAAVPGRRVARTARAAAWWVLSAIIGAATHVLWDGFTHAHGGAVKLMTWMSAPAVGSLPVFQVLQWLSSVVGLVLVAVWLTRWVRSLPVVAVPDRLQLTARCRAVVAGCLLLACAVGASVRAAPLAPGGFDAMLAPGLFGAGAATIFALLLYGLAWHLADQTRIPA